MNNESNSNKFKKDIIDLVEQEQFDTAKQMIQEYHQISPEDTEIYSISGVIAIMEGRLKDAKEILLAGIEKDKYNFDILFNLGYLYEMKKDNITALEYYRDATSSVKTKEQSSNLKAGIERIKLNLSNQNLEVKTSIEISEYYKNHLDSSIIEYFIDKDYNKIAKEIKTKVNNREYDQVILISKLWLREIGNNTAEIYYYMGVAANGIGDYQNAIEYHKKALELDNSLADLRFKKSKYQYNYDEEKINCIGCGCESFKVVNVSNQSNSEDNKELINPIRIWVRCNNCQLIYANPIPSEDILNQYYSIIAKEKFGGIYGNIDDRLTFLEDMANNRLEKIEKYTGGAKTILDIGTGIGIFICIAIDRGWHAEGLELTPEDCRYAKEMFGLDLLQENFYSFEENRKYDVVTLFEVIEHLRSPLKDLKQIYNLIKDGGILVVATPIQDTLYAKKVKEDNPFWRTVTHLSYFTKDVLSNYLKEAGFKLIEIKDSLEGKGRMEFYCRKI